MTNEERAEAVDECEGPWAEGVATAEFARELNLRSYAHAERFVFGFQRAVQDVHAARRAHGPAPRRSRTAWASHAHGRGRPHLAHGVRITKTFAPKPRD